MLSLDSQLFGLSLSRQTHACITASIFFIYIQVYIPHLGKREQEVGANGKLKNLTLGTDRVTIPVNILMSTSQVLPSLPGFVFMFLFNGRWRAGHRLAIIMTRFPILNLRFWWLFFDVRKVIK